MGFKINFKETAIKAGGVAVGALAAKLINRVIPAFIPAMAIGPAKILIGAIVPAFAPKSKVLDAVGAGFIAIGAVETVGSFAPDLVAGVNDSPISGSGVGGPIVIDEDFEDASKVNGGQDYEDVMSGAVNSDPTA